MVPRAAPPRDVRDNDVRRDPARRRVRPAARRLRPAVRAPPLHAPARRRGARLLGAAAPDPPRARARALPDVPEIRSGRLPAVLHPVHPDRPPARDVRRLHPRARADPREEGPLRHGGRRADRGLPRGPPVRGLGDPPDAAEFRAAHRGDGLLRLPARHRSPPAPAAGEGLLERPRRRASRVHGSLVGLRRHGDQPDPRGPARRGARALRRPREAAPRLPLARAPRPRGARVPLPRVVGLGGHHPRPRRLPAPAGPRRGRPSRPAPEEGRRGGPRDALPQLRAGPAPRVRRGLSASCAT